MPDLTAAERYSVVKVRAPGIGDGMFAVVDRETGEQVGRMLMFADDAERTARRLNWQERAALERAARGE